MDKLIDDIIDVILVNMDCQHEVDHDEDGVHTSVEYNLNYEAKVRGKILALLKPKITEEWIEEKAQKVMKLSWSRKEAEDFIRSLVEEVRK